jgi:hypothetical protein
MNDTMCTDRISDALHRHQLRSGVYASTAERDGSPLLSEYYFTRRAGLRQELSVARRLVSMLHTLNNGESAADEHAFDRALDDSVFFEWMLTLGPVEQHS